MPMWDANSSESDGESAIHSPFTPCPDSPMRELDDYFFPKSKTQPSSTSVEPAHPKVNNVCFIGAGFVGE